MTGKILVVLASATLAACSQSSTNVHTTPPSTTASSPTTVNLPSVTNSMLPQQLSGTITLTSVTAPGTATFTAAPLFDENADPTTQPFGGGVFSLQIAGATYASTAAQSAFMTVPDETGTQYLLLSLFAQGSGNQGQELTVLTPASAFAAGATITFDGQTSLAMLGAGDVTQPQPSFFAVATSGSVTFAPTASLTGTIDATLAATFTQAQITPDPTDPTEPRSPDGGTTAPSPIPAGTYAFVDDQPTQAQCYGALAGKEADFTALASATWAFSGGSITVSDDATGVPTVSAPQLATLFGQTAVTMSPADPGGPPWMYEAAPQAIAGAPDGTSLVAAALALEADPGNTVDGGFALAFALDSDQSSYCSVYFSYGVAP